MSSKGCMRTTVVIAVLALFIALAGCGLGESIDSRMAKAEADLDAGRYRAAEIHLKNVLQNEPANGGARLLLGRVSLATTRYDDAAEQLRRALDSGVPAEQTVSLLARALIGAGRFDEAIAVLSDRPVNSPAEHAQVAILRGDALIGLNRIEEAAASYARALELEVDSPAALVGQARIAQINDDTVRTAALLGRTLEVSPNFLPALEARGGLAYADGRCLDAVTDFKRIVDLPVTEVSRVQRFVARAFLADCQLQLKDFGPAEDNVDILVKEGPQNPYANYLQSLVSIRHQNYDTATTHLQRLLKAAPQNPRGLTLLASVKMAQGDYELAEVYLNETLARMPSNRSALRMLASLQVKQGRPDAAVERLQDALADAPQDRQIRAMLAEALVSAGDSETALDFALGDTDNAVDEVWPIGLAARMIDAGDSEAAAALLDAVDLNDGKDGQRTQQLRIVLLVKSGKTDEAIAQAKELRSRDADSPALVRLLAGTYVAAARLSDAQKVLEDGLVEHPGEDSLQLALGLIAMRQGDFERARRLLEPVADGTGDLPRAELAMAKLEGVQGNSQAAIGWLVKAHELQPENHAISIALSRAYLADDQPGKAVAVTEKLATEQPENSELRHLNGVTLLAAGRADEGIDDLVRAARNEPASRDYRMDVARAQLGADRLEAARTELLAVRERFPDYAPATVMLAMTQLRLGSIQAALATADELARNPEGKSSAETLKGSIHAAQGDFAAAAESYELARQISPTQALTFKVFEARRRAGRDEAGAILQQWLSEHPNDTAAHLVLAQWLESGGRRSEAIDAYEAVLAGERDNVAALNNLALLYAADHSERALELANRAHLRVPGNPAVTDTLGWLELRAGDRERGLALIREAARSAPGVLEIQYHLAFALAGSDEATDRTEAREIVARLLAAEKTGDARARAEKLSELLATSSRATGG